MKDSAVPDANTPADIDMPPCNNEGYVQCREVVLRT